MVKIAGTVIANGITTIIGISIHNVLSIEDSL